MVWLINKLIKYIKKSITYVSHFMGPLFLFRIKKKKTLKGQRQQLLKIRGGGKRPRSSSGNIRSIGGWRNRFCTSDDDIVGENKTKSKRDME